MLVVGRKKGERIVLRRDDEEIVITYIGYDRAQNRIGIEADESWNISREGPSKERWLGRSGDDA